MINIKLTERERDFLKSVIYYFEINVLEDSRLITRKGFRFRKEEMAKLQDKLK